ncbi:DUF2569 family protein [Ralstonia insidiosa]|uniref:DUF2569 family protein n=1 Tax=Ralstonia insidiosa TaxID=190721 RepID=UPI000CEDEAF1|nr:DUF2569 family protein [Ralstonia insidiosa]
MSSDRAWVSVGTARAATHPLYGVGGWLTVYLVATVLGLLLAVGKLYVLANTPVEVGHTIFHEMELPAPGPFQSVGFLTLFAACTTFCLAIAKSRHFRLWVSLHPIVLAPISLLIINDEAPLAQVIEISVQALLGSAVWIGYVWRSRRVRVTFESKVRSDDPWLATQWAISSDSPGAPSRPPVSAH